MTKSNDFVGLRFDNTNVQVKILWRSSDLVSLTNAVASSCIIDGKYYPAIFEYAFRYYLIRYASDYALPEDEDELEHFVMRTDLAKQIELYQASDLRELCEDTILEELCANVRADISRSASFSDRLIEAVDSFILQFKEISLPDNFAETLTTLQEVANDPEKLAKTVIALNKTGDN